MPLFGRSTWSDGEVDGTIRLEQTFLEMPQAPPLYKHALTGGRRIAIQAVRELNLLEATVEHFEVFAAGCDAYSASHELPFVADDRDIVSRDRNLSDAARLTCLKRHFLHMVLQLGVDVALTLGAVRAGWSFERTGQIGSPRWEMAQVAVGGSGTQTVFSRVKQPNWFIWGKIALHRAHTTVAIPDEGRTDSTETLERLFQINLSGVSMNRPDLCECGCSVRDAAVR